MINKDIFSRVGRNTNVLVFNKKKLVYNSVYQLLVKIFLQIKCQ